LEEFSVADEHSHDHTDFHPPQEVPAPEVRRIEFSVVAVFTVGDSGELAENEKINQIESALSSLPGLDDVEVEVTKVLSAEETEKVAVKEEKAERKEEEKARKEDEEATEAGENVVEEAGEAADEAEADEAKKS